MKAPAIAFIVIVLGTLVLWVLGDTPTDHLAQLLPLVHGGKLNATFEIGGLVMLVIFLLGIIRMVRRTGRDDE